MFSQRSLATGVSALTVLVGCLLVTRSALAQTYLPAIPGSLDDTQRIEQALDACNAPEKRALYGWGPESSMSGSSSSKIFMAALWGPESARRS